MRIYRIYAFITGKTRFAYLEIKLPPRGRISTRRGAKRRRGRDGEGKKTTATGDERQRKKEVVRREGRNEAGTLNLGSLSRPT